MQTNDCFGHFKEKKESCKICEFAESCHFAKIEQEETRTKEKAWQNQKHWNLFLEGRQSEENPGDEEILDFINSNITEPGEAKKEFTRDDLIDSWKFILELREDNEVLQVLKNRLKDYDPLSSIGRRYGKSRQFLRDRIGKELSRILGYQTNRMKREFKAILTKREYEIFILITEKGLSSREIAKRLKISKRMVNKHSQNLSLKLGKNIPDLKNNN